MKTLSLRNYVLILFFCLFFSACGGGDGGGGEKSNSGIRASPGSVDFKLNQDDYDVDPKVVIFTLPGGISYDYYIDVYVVDGTSIRYVDYEVNETAKEGYLYIYPERPYLLDVGIYKDDVVIEICKDYLCLLPVEGSPKTVGVTYTVGSPDYDKDGTPDDKDIDDDNDGVPDTEDALPYNENESLDSDGDLIGNNSDPDDDNDGVPDEIDLDPLDPSILEATIEIEEYSEIVVDHTSTSATLENTYVVSKNLSTITWSVVDTSENMTATGSHETGFLETTIHTSLFENSKKGTYEEWVKITYDFPGNPQEAQTKTFTFDISLDLPGIEYVTPRVVYVGKSPTIRLRGYGLGSVEVADIDAGSLGISSLSQVSDEEVEITLSSISSSGEYELKISNDLGLTMDSAKIISKQHPVFPTTSITIPYSPSIIVYEPEREKFYFSSGWSGQAVYSLEVSGSAWVWDQIPIASPGGIALTRDGETLIVGTYSCQVFEIALDTDATTSPASPNSCYYDDYGFVAQFYTGLTVIADTNQWPSMYTYPDWGRTPFSVPSEHSPFGIISDYGTHMIWAGRPTTSGSRTAYVYDVRDNVMNVLGTIAGDYYQASNFSISAMGERIAHEDDIYDSQLAYIGSLGDSNDAPWAVGVSPDGTRAGMFDWDTKEIRVFDISTKGNFQELSYSYTLAPESSAVRKILFSENNAYMFVFGSDYDTNINKMYIYKL